MGLDSASQLGTTQDVMNNIQLFMALFKFVLPIISVLLCIEMIRIIKKAIKKRAELNKNKKKQQEIKEEAKKKQKQKIDKLYENDEFLIKQLDGTQEPLDKRAYRELDITFDKKGKVIK